MKQEMNSSDWNPGTQAKPSRAERLHAALALRPAGTTFVKGEGRVGDVWFTASRFGLLLLALMVVVFWDVIVGSHTFFYRDYGCFGYPLAHFHRDSFWNGEIPFWNPLNSAGLPFLAQWNTLTLYPLSLIYLLLPEPWGLGGFVLAHFWLAGMTMYHAAHHWSGNRLAACVAGLTYAASGLMQHALMWPNNIAALAWMPLVVLMAERASREGGRLIVLAAAVSALQLLTGAPEVIFLTWMVVGLMWAAHWRWGAAGLSLSLKSGRILAVVGLLAFGLASMQLLPFLDLAAHSQRNLAFSTGVWSMPRWGWANLLVPMFHCTGSLLGVYSPDEQQWTASYYVGIATLALAALAIVRNGKRRTNILGIVAVLGFILALGEHGIVYRCLKMLFPVLGVVRFPVKFIVLSVFAVPLLAALALAAWQKRPGYSLEVERRWFIGLWLVVVVLIGLVIAWACREASPGENWPDTAWNGCVRIIFLSLTVACVLGLRRISSPAGALLLRFTLLGLLALDLFTHLPRLNPAVMVDAYRPEVSQRPWQLALGEGRAMVSPRVQAFLDYAGTSDALNFVHGQRTALVPNWNLLDGTPSVGGFYSLYTREQDEALRLFQGTTNFPASFADFLGVQWISSDKKLFAWQRRHSAEPMVTVGRRAVFADRDTTLRALRSPTFNPALEVFLPPEARGHVESGNVVQARVISSKWSDHGLRIEVDAAATAMVTIAQAAAPGWRAEVDGKPATLWRANHAFQAVEVPAGHSSVVLRYSERTWPAGIALTLASGVVCALLWCRWKQQPPPGLAASVSP